MKLFEAETMHGVRTSLGMHKCHWTVNHEDAEDGRIELRLGVLPYGKKRILLDQRRLG